MYAGSSSVNCMFPFVGAFEKVRKATVSFVMCVSPSVLPSVRTELIGSHQTDFHEIWYLSSIRKFVQKIQVSLKSDRVLNMKPYVHLLLRISEFFLEWEMFLTGVVEKLKTQVIFNTLLFCRKFCHLWDQCGKIWQNQTGHRWQYNTAHALCELDN